MYPRRTAKSLCRVWRWMTHSGTPALAAVVTKPARRECAEYVGADGSCSSFSFRYPAARACTSSRSCPLKRGRGGCRRCRADRSGGTTGPFEIRPSCIHASRDRTGQVRRFSPYGSPTSAPAPSWSVFERRIEEHDSVRPNGDVFCVESNELGATERPDEADEEKSSVSRAGQAWWRRRQHLSQASQARSGALCVPWCRSLV